MTRSATALVALITSVCALTLATGAPASANSRQPGQAAHRIGRIAPETPAPGGPRTWHVLVGGHASGQAVQAEGYYPHVITIDAGDTVVWTLNTKEIHTVTFAGTCEEESCIPPCVFTVSIDISPCGSASYDGVSALDSSGRMVPPGYNWDNSYPHGGTTFSLTFTTPGAHVYFDLSYAGMRGVVVVNPAGTPYPFTQAQYSGQAQDQLRADLAAGARARYDSPPAITGPDGTRTYHVATGVSSPQKPELASTRQQAPPRTGARPSRNQAPEPRRTRPLRSASGSPAWHPAAFMPSRSCPASAERRPRPPAFCSTSCLIPRLSH